MFTFKQLQHTHPELADHYRADVLAEAESICHAGLIADPDQPRLLHLRGLLAVRSGQRALGLAYLTRAAALDSGNALYAADLGAAYEANGRPDKALDSYHRALSLKPDDAALHRAAGRLQRRLGQFDEALSRLLEVQRLEPKSARSHVELGELLESRNLSDQAFAHFTQAVLLDPTEAEGLRCLGYAYLRRGNVTAAHHIFRQGLRLRPDQGVFHRGLGEALLRSGSLDAAADAFRSAVALNPRDIEACRQLVCCLELLGRRDETVTAWCHLGEALSAAGHGHQAAEAYRQALERKSGYLAALYGLGLHHFFMRHFEDAIPCFEAALTIAPNHAGARFYFAQASGFVGNLERVWRTADSSRLFEQPAWDGESLEGRTILVWVDADLGLGDTIQLMRYVSLVHARGASVMIECPASFTAFFERMRPPLARVVRRGMPLPPFDVHAAIAQLPRLLHIRLDSIPALAPYLSVDRRGPDRWRRRLGRPRRVATIGLVWTCRDPLSSQAAPLAAFEALAGVPSIRLVSLQQGPQVGELLALPPGLAVDVLTEGSSSLADTASLVLNLDLVITVDTMVAHLAGALARPVWTLIAYECDWKWFVAGDTTPWYPTMRLFRQTHAGDWETPIKSMCAALRELLNTTQS